MGQFLWSTQPKKELEEPEQTYEEHVQEAMQEVTTGQHLRFIGYMYKTKEVCLAAVKYESTHACQFDSIHDFNVVPMGNLDYVVEHMREIKKDDLKYLEGMEKAYLRRKEEEKKPGYYGKEYETYQNMLDHYGAKDYDDMLRKRFSIAK